MTTTLTTYNKDPEAVLDYIFDWSSWLATGEEISTEVVSISLAAGSYEPTITLELDSEEFDESTVTAWISGGTMSTTYRVECKITTNSNRVDVRGILIRVTDRW